MINLDKGGLTRIIADALAGFSGGGVLLALLVNAGLFSPYLGQAVVPWLALAALLWSWVRWYRGTRDGGSHWRALQGWTRHALTAGFAMALLVWGAGSGFVLPGRTVIPVLTYHRVTARVPAHRRYPVPHVSPAEFEAELAWLQRHGYRSVPPEALLPGFRGHLPPKPVLITFDDGWRDNYSAVAALRRRGFTAVIFAVSGSLGRPLNLTEGQLLALDRQGVVIGSHTVTHPHLERLSSTRLHAELVQSKAKLEEILGHPVTLFCYPYGSGDLSFRVMRAVRLSGYQLAFSSHNFGLATVPGSRFAVRRVLMEGAPWLARVELALLVW